MEVETYDFLNHIHDLLLDKIEALCISGRRTTNHVVDLDIIIFLADSSTIHGIREFDENRIFFHDALDVLTANANDALVVLVRDVERDRSWHFLLNEVKAILCSFVLVATDVNVEVVFVEAIKDDLNGT